MKERDRIEAIVADLSPEARGALEQLRRSSVPVMAAQMAKGVDLDELEEKRLLGRRPRPRSGGIVVELTPYGRVCADKILGLETNWTEFLNKEVPGLDLEDVHEAPELPEEDADGEE